VFDEVHLHIISISTLQLRIIKLKKLDHLPESGLIGELNDSMHIFRYLPEVNKVMKVWSISFKLSCEYGFMDTFNIAAPRTPSSALLGLNSKKISKRDFDSQDIES